MNALLIVIIVLLGLIGLLLYFVVQALKALVEGFREGIDDLKELDTRSLQRQESLKSDRL